MAERQDEAYSFEFSGGRLCLDFANTVSNRAEPRPREHLDEYADLVAWACQAGLLTASVARRLVDAGARRPKEAAAVLVRAIGLREAIYRTFGAVAGGHSPEPADLATLNEALARALARSRIVPTADGFDWGWTDEDELDRMLWPVARSAADLLTSDERGAVRVCPAHDCAWLFEDRSRNGSRRWCDMKVCGNRAKARRYQERKRGDRG